MRDVPYIDFAHDTRYTVVWDEFEEFIKLYGLVKYPWSETWKKDRRVFAMYGNDVQIYHKDLLPKTK